MKWNQLHLHIEAFRCLQSSLYEVSGLRLVYWALWDQNWLFLGFIIKIQKNSIDAISRILRLSGLNKRIMVTYNTSKKTIVWLKCHCQRNWNSFRDFLKAWKHFLVSINFMQNIKFSHFNWIFQKFLQNFINMVSWCVLEDHPLKGQICFIIGNRYQGNYTKEVQRK